MGMLEDKAAAPRVDVRHPSAAALQLRLTDCLNANTLEMTRLLS